MSRLEVFPDPEKLICSLLPPALAARPEPYAAGVLVDVRIPNPRRERMVIVNADGGTGNNRVQAFARVRLRTFATSDPDATDLALLAAAIIVAAVDANPICRVDEVGRPVSVPDAVQPCRVQWLQLLLASTGRE